MVNDSTGWTTNKPCKSNQIGRAYFLSKEFQAFQSWRFTPRINQSAPAFNSQRSWWTWDHHGWWDDSSGGESKISRRQKGSYVSRLSFDACTSVASIYFIHFPPLFCSGSRDGASWRSRPQSLVSWVLEFFSSALVSCARRCHAVPALAVPRASLFAFLSESIL